MNDAADAITRLADAENPLAADIGRTHEAVAAIAADYAALLADVPAEERERVERTHGRKVIDLKRHAGTLPARATTTGQAATKAPDVPADGGWPFLIQRAPGKSISTFAGAKRSDPTGHRVGHEVEAWCGPCGGLTDHTIVALVDGQPKQVICVACKSKHGYRTTPARGKAGVEVAPVRQPRKPTREELESERKRDARFALQKELAEAAAVRPFTKRDRYKAGEIIEHPEHGRGKIENVLRSSLLVRFPAGLKSLSLL